MSEIQERIKGYLHSSAKVMQIATVQGGQPWICTVYFVADDQQNLYWLSLPSRKHSQQIAENDKIAVAIAIKHDKPVIGIQAMGRAEVIDDSEEIRRVMQLYVTKYGQGKDFYDNFVAGKNQHALYKCTPSEFVLFDEVHFDRVNSRNNWKLAEQ